MIFIKLHPSLLDNIRKFLTCNINYTTRNRSRGVQKTLYMIFHENSMKNVIDLIFLGHLKFAKSLYRFANRFLANLRTIR
jgi:hypothetical protein